MLRNRTKRMQVYHLPHSHHCVGDTCHCTRTDQPVATHDPKTGETGIAIVPKSFSKTLVFLAGETKEVTDGAMECPDIKTALARRDLVPVVAAQEDQ